MIGTTKWTAYDIVETVDVSRADAFGASWSQAGHTQRFHAQLATSKDVDVHLCGSSERRDR